MPMLRVIAAALLWMITGACCSLVPALFVFGDTLVDVGNNNLLLTRARANFPPFGHNFPLSVPTGRFSDGKLVHDFIASHLGLPSPPAFLTARNYTRGVNFGCAGSGINKWAGNGAVMSLEEQIDKFSVIRKRWGARLSISSSIFYICTGNQDASILLRLWGSLSFNHRDELLDKLSVQVKRLYALGARKFVMVGLSALGCFPTSQLVGRCAWPGVYAALYYNLGLAELMSDLQYSSMPSSEYVIADLTNLMLTAKSDPSSFGFVDAVHSCCPTDEPTKPCYRNARFCPSPSKYMFWDINSLSHAFNKITAQHWWRGSNPFISPMNISSLAITN